METNGIIAKWCRICSSELESGIHLFGDEAKKALLNAKIRRYLALTISAEDKLPKMICEECHKKLDEFHRFATMALRNQDKMVKHVVDHNDGSHQEHKSLLHNYLTKGIKEKEIVTEATASSSEVTEMEVRVDPMTILQCTLELEGEEDCGKDEDPQTLSDSPQASNYYYYCDKYRKPYLCSSCPRSFTSELALQNHSWNHSTSNHNQSNQDATRKSYSVLFNTYCQELEGQENDAAVLIPNAKQQEQEGTDDNSSINNNNNEDSDDELKDERLSCPICGKVVTTKGNLKVHLETHRPKGKYGCDICGRIFKTQCNLFRHKEYHDGIQYPCEVCGRVYPTNSTLRAHSITHSDLRPHKCPLCDKTFKRNQDLKFHINQHTGARPYQCPYCPKAFASSGNCFSHRKRMHPVEVERDRERAAKIMR